MNGASTVGRLCLAHFSDLSGALNMHIGSQLTASLLTLLFWTLVGSETGAIAFCVVFGVFSGMVIGLPPASIGNILNCTYTSPENKLMAKSKLGHWTGMMYTFAAIPALTGPLIAGHLITKYNTYLTVQLWSGACLMISCACMCVSRWYLPCVNGESAATNIVQWCNKRSCTGRGKGRAGDTDFSERISQAPTRVPSVAPSLDKFESPPRTMERAGDQMV